MRAPAFMYTAQEGMAWVCHRWMIRGWERKDRRTCAGANHIDYRLLRDVVGHKPGESPAHSRARMNRARRTRQTACMACARLVVSRKWSWSGQ